MDVMKDNKYLLFLKWRDNYNNVRLMSITDLTRKKSVSIGVSHGPK